MGVEHAKHISMTKSQAIEHFGSAAALARALGVSRSAVSHWPEEIPLGRQYQIEVATKGALRADQHVTAQVGDEAA
jgi:transcriptional repressor of cell division inhibition gene dicB